MNGREAEGMKEQKQASSSSRLMEDNKTIINIQGVVIGKGKVGPYVINSAGENGSAGTSSVEVQVE